MKNLKNIEKKQYKGYTIYIHKSNFTPNILQFSKDIIDKNYEIIKKFKDTERNFVAQIKLQENTYILKSPKAETVIPLRKVQTVLKNGEALESLINLSTHKENGLDFFLPPIAVIVKKSFFIQESFILMEYLPNNNPRSLEFLDSIMEVVNKMHKLKIYHGDLNASNFIKTPQGVKVIDTQGKLDSFSNFKRAYDYLTFKRDLLPNELGYDIDKNFQIDKNTIGYFLAFIIKEFKHLPFIKKIRSLKKDLRNKGWKI